MLEPISITVGACCLGYAILGDYARNVTAVCHEAEAVRKIACETAESAETSHALFGEKTAAITALMKLATECAEQGWDGAGAAELDPSALVTAKDFVRAMPPELPLPEFAPEPDGSISMDWIQSRLRRFSLSIGRSNRLAFAWLDGTDKGHGVACFNGTSIPPQVLVGIRSIMNQRNATFRAA